MVFFRGGDVSRPLYVPYSKFVAFISKSISPASALLLQTNGTDNGSQTLLNLIQGSGITIADNGTGGITISSTGGGSITADNGLTITGSNVQLGSPTPAGAPLLHDTYIDTLTDKTLFLEGQKTNALEYILNVSNTANDGNAILASALGLGTALRATSISASAVSANSTNAPAVSASSGGSNEAGLFTNSDAGTNNIVQGIRLRHSSSAVPASGFGISAEFSGKTTLNSDLRLGRLSFLWTDAITSSRTSKFQVHTVNSGTESVKLELSGGGQAKLNLYGLGSFSGTAAYNLAVDASGNVIEVSASGGGGITSINLDANSAQTLSIGTSGTSPNWVDDGLGDHKLNIPLATTIGVSAGLVSNSAIKSLSNSSFPYVERQYYTPLSNGATALVKVPSTNTLFMCTLTSDRVTCWNTATGQLLSETIVNNPTGMVYVESGNSAGVTQGEVLVFTSTSIIFTFVASTGALIGSQVVAGLSSNIKGCVDLSGINNNVYGYASGGTINIIDVSAAVYTRTSYLMVGTGAGTFELQYVTSGNHSGLIVGCSQTGIWAYNPALNTVAISPTNLGVLSSAYSIKHIPLLDQYVVCGFVSNNVVLVDADTSSSFALNTSFESIANPSRVEIDPLTNLAYVSTFSGNAAANVIITTFDMNSSELKIIRARPIASIGSISYMSPEYSENAIYVVGVAGVSIPSKLIYSE
jgi:hypothetical protein